MEIVLTQGKITLVDDDVYDWASEYRWCAQRTPAGAFYAVRTTPVPESLKVQLHREIVNAPNGMVVDHIDGDGLNNQRSNIRVATRGQNICNSGLGRLNRSGFKGVSMDKRSGYWRACIQFGGKNTHLGYFGSPIDAARAYDAAARVHHGEFAWLNFPEDR